MILKDLVHNSYTEEFAEARRWLCAGCARASSYNKIPGAKESLHRHLGGDATCTHMFHLNTRDLAAQILLDLGNLDELAKVSVSNKGVGILWTPPFQIDNANYMHAGENTSSIAVTNLWVNRLIGDRHPGVTRKYTFTITPTYESVAPLRITGLLGPVRLDDVGTNGRI